MLARLGAKAPDESNWHGRLQLLAELADDSSGVPPPARIELFRVGMRRAVEEAIDEGRASEDDGQAILILLGLHEDYGVGANLTERLAVVASYVVPKYYGRRPANDLEEKRMAGAVDRRLRDRLLRRSLQLFDHKYGRTPEAVRRGDDQVEQKRRYVVDAQRRIRLQQHTDTIRASQEPYDGTAVWLARYDDEAVSDTIFRITQPPDGNSVTVNGPVYLDERPHAVLFGIEFEHEYHLGDVITYSYEYEIQWSAVPRILDEYIVTSANNDGYTLDMNLHFEGVLPNAVYAVAGADGTNLGGILPEDSVKVEPQGHDYHYTWRSTQRRIAYGLRWVW